MCTQSNCPISLPSFADLSTGSPSIRPLSLPGGSPSSGSTSHIREIAHGNHNKQRNIHNGDESNRHVKAISMLLDDILLEIFDCYQNAHFLRHWKWHVLVQVCQRWRQIVFASPHRFNLEILCTNRTPTRKNLDIWPAFPIVIDISNYHLERSVGLDNVIAALGRPDRVCYVSLSVAGSQMAAMATVMQEPFPALTHLHFLSADEDAPVLPAEFLGGSTPRLQEIALSGFPFLGLPTLLLSACDLIHLSLYKIPPTGYFSPETIVACLATLPRLKRFTIEFQSATPCPDHVRPPVTRTVLPALTSFQFHGACEYLEDLVAQMDGPRLDAIIVSYLNEFVDFQVPQPELSQFIDRSIGLTAFRRADVGIYSNHVALTLYRHANHTGLELRAFHTNIKSKAIYWHVSLAQVLTQFSVTLSNMVHLKLKVYLDRGRPLEACDVEWLHLLHQFSAVQSLYVLSTLAWHVALALEDITVGMAAEVLPSLHSICLMGQPSSSIEKFITARRLCGRPVAVIDAITETEYDELTVCQEYENFYYQR